MFGMLQVRENEISLCAP